jgi:AhpD family alkylhydroperoxidase
MSHSSPLAFPASRIDMPEFSELAPDVVAAMRTLSAAAAKAGIEHGLIELVKIRASQINGCAFCVQYHLMLAEKHQVPREKLDLVVVWREVAMFSPRERAALAWTEALTLVAQGVDTDLYNEVRTQFSEKEIVYLSSAIAAINAWNRFGAALQWTPPARKAT